MAFTNVHQSYECQYPHNIVDVELLTYRIHSALDRNGAKRMRRNGNSLEFRGGFMRFVLSTNLLVAITRGVVHVRRVDGRVKIECTLWFSQLIWASLAGACFFGIAGRAMGFGLPGCTAMALLAFVFFYYGNRIAAVHRFRQLLRRCDRETGEAG